MSPTATVPGTKIDSLFYYRKIPWLLAQGNIADVDFESQLKRLQSAIYDLDYYLESTWKIDQRKLSSYWNKIYSVLSDFGLSKLDQKEWSKQILKYQEHELSTRECKSPTRYAIRHLYFYKSCDVKLIRRLIYYDAPNLKKVVQPVDWTAFDLLTEVNDDIEDIREDMTTYNCNRFLFEIKEHGVSYVRKSYRAFIRSIVEESEKRQRNHQKSKGARQVHEWTEAIRDQTLKLLEKRLHEFSKKEVSKAIIFAKVP